MKKAKSKNIKWDKKEIEFWKEVSGNKLDDIDVKIYLGLRENGKLSDTDLASIVGVSIPTVRRRRRALQEKGYLHILGILIFEEFGIASADVIIRLKKDTRKEDIEEFIQEAINNPKVFEIDEYMGEYDVIIKFFDKDLKELKKTIEDFLLAGKGIVDRYLILPVVSSPKLFTKHMKYMHE